MAGVKAAHSRVPYAELERWPEDGRRYELYDGEVYVVPSPLPLHQVVAARLHLVLEEYVRQHGGLVLFAPLDIVLTEYDVVQPDLLLFTQERRHLVQLRSVTRQAPDLAVEILSPSTADNDRGRKMQVLARHGVRECWLVDAAGPGVEVYRLVGDQYALASHAIDDQPVQSPLLPELSFTPRDLLAGLQG